MTDPAELESRIAAIEQRLSDRLDPADLRMSRVSSWLEQRWQPDPAVLLGSGLTKDMLPADTMFEIVGNAVQSTANGLVVAAELATTSSGTNEHLTRVGSAIQATSTGLVLAIGSMLWDANATGTRGAWLRRNAEATAYGYVEGPPPPTSGAPAITCVALLPVVEGDTIDLLTFQNSGVALNSPAGYRRLQAFRLV